MSRLTVPSFKNNVLPLLWQLLVIVVAGFSTTTSTTRRMTAAAEQPPSPQSSAVVVGPGGTPWIIPFGIIGSLTENDDNNNEPHEEHDAEYFASALVYDSELDRIYVTGVSHTNLRNRPTMIDDDSQKNDDDDGRNRNDDYTEGTDDYYKNENSDDSVTNDTATTTTSDCFLGILQIPRRGSSDSTITTSTGTTTTTTTTNAGSMNDWVRQHTQIGSRDSNEACSGIDIVRRGNDRKVYIIGHSIHGPSVLQTQLDWLDHTQQQQQQQPPLTNHNNSSSSSNSSSITNSTNSTMTAAVNHTTGAEASSETLTVYGFVMDVTWYNGHVPTGFLMHHVPVEYPIGITASSLTSNNEDIYVASIQSLSGIVNPAHTLYETMKRQMDAGVVGGNATTNSKNGIVNATTTGILYDTTTSGAYVPPKYGERYAFHLRRIGERTLSMIDLMTLPEDLHSNNNVSSSEQQLYESKVEGSKLLNLLRLSKRIKTTTEKSKTANETTTTTTNATRTNANTTTTGNTVLPDEDDEGDDTTVDTPPLSFDEYRFVVEPYVERWGRTFSANIQEESSSTIPTLRPSMYSIQVSSLLRCTITTFEEESSSPNLASTNVPGGENDESNIDDDRNDDSINFIQRRQDTIFVAGSTRGSGMVLGGDIGDTSLHGFVSSFDATTGVLLRRRPIVTSSTVASTTTSSSSNSVSRSPGYTVRVLGMCQQDPYSQPTTMSIYQSAHYLYVVGMTDGVLDHESYATQHRQSSALRVGVYQAFIQKIDASTLSVQWTKQLGAAKFLNATNTTQTSQYGSIHGIACAVTPDGLQVYLGGTVLSGATITLDGGTTSSTKNYGRDDMFVAQYMASDGKMNYVKQIGTPQDDSLANGVSLVADKYGNAIVLGNTRGKLFESKDNTNLANKVILLSVDRSSGNHVDISGETKPLEMPVEQTTTQQPTPGPSAIRDDESSISSWSNLSKINIVYVCILGILTTAVLISMLLSVYTCRQRNRTDEMISRYLRSVVADNTSNDDDDGNNRNDVERAKLFTKGIDGEYGTESSCDDEYETVHFVSTSRHDNEPPSMHAAPKSSYQDTLLKFNEATHQENNKKAKSKRSSKEKTKREDFYKPGNDPLHRWLVRDP